jgi:hypothetical protein
MSERRANVPCASRIRRCDILDQMNDFIEVYGDFLARRYPNEHRSAIQWKALNAWVTRNSLNGIAMWRGQDKGTFFIVVFDLTGRAPEFTWSGEPFKLSDSRMQEFIRRAEEFVRAGGVAGQTPFPPGSRLSRAPDGRFALVIRQG